MWRTLAETLPGNARRQEQFLTDNRSTIGSLPRNAGDVLYLYPKYSLKQNIKGRKAERQDFFTKQLTAN